MLKKLIVILVLMVASCTQRDQLGLTEAEAVYAAKKIIVVGAESNFPPYSSLSSTGEVVGLSIDVLKKVADRSGLRLNIRHYANRSEMLNDFYAGKLDVLAAVNPTPQQLIVMGLTEPYALLSTVMLLNDLPVSFPLKVAYAPEYFGQDRLVNLKKQVSIIPLDNDHLAFRALMVGTVDGIVTNLGSAFYFERRYDRHFNTAPIDFPYALSFGFQQDNEMLGSVLQKAVHSLSPVERSEMKLEYEAPAPR